MIIFYIVCIFIFIFGAVILFGAPYLPTLKKQTDTALDMLDLKPGQTLIELGSGDGRVMLAAARKGINVIGYELNPFLVVVSYFVTFRYRRQVKIIWGNFWAKSWPKADGVFVFLIDRYMEKLDHKMTEYQHKPIKIASFAFQIPDKKPSKKLNGVYIYNY